MSDKFHTLMNAVDDDLLEEAMSPVKRRKPMPWIGAAIAACLVLVIGLAQFEGHVPPVAAAQLAEMGYEMKLPENAEKIRYEIVSLAEQKAAQASFVIQGTKYIYQTMKTQEQLQLSSDASYFYYCANNTIYGTEWGYVPETGDVPLVCDMSSNILSCPVDVSKYGIIYAGAQKNMAPAGLTVVIIREDLAGNAMPFTPVMMDYQTMIDKDSMYNTPPC